MNLQGQMFKTQPIKLATEMVDDDRIREDQMRDAFMARIRNLREVQSGYGLVKRQSSNPTEQLIAGLADGLLKFIIDSAQMQLHFIENANTMSRTIIELRREMEQLREEIRGLKDGE